MPISARLDFRPWSRVETHNQSNRRIRNRTYGGVGGAEERSSPLSRSESLRHVGSASGGDRGREVSLGGADGSERGGGEPGVELGLGGLGGLAQPGMGGVREVREQFFESPIFGRREGGVAERIGKAPTHPDEVVEAPLIGNGIVVVASDGGSELVGEVPVQGEIGARGA